MKQNPQVSATITPELNEEIVKMAEKESRSVSGMVAVLLHYAVKEKNRKKKNSQVQNYSTN
jgi:hypothetical protein